MKYIKLYEAKSKLKKEVKHYIDGGISSEIWKKNDRPHRNDGPAEIRYWPDGTVSNEWWFQNGVLHREDGPAAIHYNPDGSIDQEEWHFEGTRYSNAEEVWLAKMGLMG